MTKKDSLRHLVNFDFSYPIAERPKGIGAIRRKLNLLTRSISSKDFSTIEDILSLGEKRYTQDIEHEFYRAFIDIKFTVDEALALLEVFPKLEGEFQKRSFSIFVIGIGAGREPINLELMGHEVMGIDSNAELVNIANEEREKRGLKGRYWIQDFLKNPNIEGKFDLVYITPGVNSHFPTQKLRVDFLRNAGRLIKENGRLITTVDIDPFPVISMRGLTSLLLKFKMEPNVSWSYGDLIRTWLGNHNNTDELIYFHVYQSEKEFYQEVVNAGLIGTKVTDSSSWILRRP